MSSMTSYITNCIDDVTGSQDHHFLLQPEAVHELLGTKDSAFRAGDKATLNMVQDKLS